MHERRTSEIEVQADEGRDGNTLVAADEPTEELSVLGSDGMLPLSPHITEAAGLREGAVIYASITDAGILLRGGRPSDSKHRWSRARQRLKKLQAASRRQQEAQREAEGRRVYFTLEEFFESLEEDETAQDDAAG